MEDRRRQHRIGAAVADRRDEVGRAGGATRRDDRHPDPVADGAKQLGVEAGARAVAVDRGDQQLAGAQVDDPLGPGDRVEVGRLASALDDDLPGGLVPWRRRRASMATTTAWRPKRPAQRATSVGSATAAVFSETLSAPARSTSRISSRCGRRRRR